MLFVARHQTPKTQKIIVDLSLEGTSREQYYDYVPKPAGYRTSLKGCQPENRLGGLCAAPFPQPHPQGSIHRSRAQGKGECFSAKFGDIGRMGRTRQPVRVEPPTSAANTNLKASSRARPTGVRHPLTSLPFFHLRSDLLRLFSGNGTSGSHRLKSDRMVQT